MPEVATSGEDHGDAGLVGSRDHLLVAHRAAGLNDRRGAGFYGRHQAVATSVDGPLSDPKPDLQIADSTGR